MKGQYWISFMVASNSLCRTFKEMMEINWRHWRVGQMMRKRNSAKCCRVGYSGRRKTSQSGNYPSVICLGSKRLDFSVKMEGAGMALYYCRYNNGSTWHREVAYVWGNSLVDNEKYSTRHLIFLTPLCLCIPKTCRIGYLNIVSKFRHIIRLPLAERRDRCARGTFA